MADATVRRVDFGYFIRPAEETGTGMPRVEPCLGYLVRHPDGMVLLDTGMGAHPDVDAPGLRYELLDGEAEILPGVYVVPTPGHTAGHQSLVVRRPDGTVIVAGQAHDTATAYSADALAWRAHRDGHARGVPAPPGWLDRLMEFDAARVLFAHDHTFWMP